MTRQYYVMYKRIGSREFAKLEPGPNAALYGKPEVQAAIEHMRVNPTVDGMSICLGDERYNVIAFAQDAIAPKAFIFAGEPGGPALPSPQAAVESIPGGATVTKTLA